VPALGDTLQAVRGHEYCGVLETPGDCDLTAHVDFEALNGAARAAGARTCGVVTQRRFLRQLGIEARARHLQRNADVSAAEDVDGAIARLVGCDQMGELYKVCAIASPGLPAPYPFTPEAA